MTNSDHNLLSAKDVHMNQNILISILLAGPQ